MKIFDENKLMGKPFSLLPDDDNALKDCRKKARIILYKRLKSYANGQKILLLKNENNHFRVPTNRVKNKDHDLRIFYEVWLSIVKKKIKKGEIELIEFNSQDKKIKTLGRLANNITEINSNDPRLLLLWHYNPNIIMNIWFKGKRIGAYSKQDFLREFKNFNMSKKADWQLFLYYFETTKNPKISNFGWKSLVKEFNKKSEQANAHSLERLKNVQILLSEMA